MGIPADYKDSGYAGKVPLSPKVSMLLLTKEQLALQECVGESEVSLTEGKLSVGSSIKGLTLACDRPSERAPIKVVDGRPWSPGVYRALRIHGQATRGSMEKGLHLLLSLLINNLRLQSYT